MPVVVWLIIAGRLQTAFAVFVFAGITDAVDGFLAKRFDWQTELGAYLDPLADKALLMSIYLALGFFGYLPAWIVIVVVSRDILIIGAILLAWMMNRPIPMQPHPISKANTLGQIVLAALVLGGLGFQAGLDGMIQTIIFFVGGLTILSAIAYLLTWLRHMASYEPHTVPMRTRRTVPPSKDKAVS